MTPNFYIDIDGKEQPIIYQAADLVNKPAPAGYHWELDKRPMQARLDELQAEIVRRNEQLSKAWKENRSDGNDRWIAYLELKLEQTIKAAAEVTRPDPATAGYIAVRDEPVQYAAVIGQYEAPTATPVIDTDEDRCPLGPSCDECNPLREL